MKITQRNIILIIIGLTLCLNFVISLEKSKHKQNFGVRPNVGDLNTHFQKVVKPFIETPFIPIEIEKLQENKRRGAHDYSMSSAMLVGPKSATGSEKPTMYSTVINSHTTAIKHETPQPRGLGVHPAAAGAFAVDPAQTLAMHEKEINQVPSGAYSIPVQMNAATHVGDGFETPNFMHKKERKIQESEGMQTGSESSDPAVFLQQNMQKDISDFTAQFDNTKDKAERIATMIKGKRRLQDDMVNISKGVQAQMKELFMAKEVALKLTNLNNYYTTKIKRDQLSSLKLSDVITVKNLLRQKILKELQGLRTSSADYAELDNVNPQDIQIIMKEIRIQLGK